MQTPRKYSVMKLPECVMNRRVAVWPVNKAWDSAGGLQAERNGYSKTWVGDPLECPCCKGTMRPVRQVIRKEEIEFFLRLHGLWEGFIQLPRPPPPPFDIETMEPLEPPWQAIKEWIPDEEPDLDWFNRPRIF
jgi:hypothetical protein